MGNIQLREGTIEPHLGRNVDRAQVLLKRWKKGEGYIPSEGDLRLLGVRNYKNAPELIKTCWDTSTLSATKGGIVKVILPYETGSRTLTDVARFCFELIKPTEFLVNGGVDLDINERWERLNGSGVYTRQREDWFEKGEEGKLIGLNQGMKEGEAIRCPLLLTKLGHPDYVDSKFARSEDEVAEIIGDTFKLGKSEYGYDTMMGQYLPDVDDKGVLNAWYVGRLGGRSRSNAWTLLDSGNGRFAFFSVGDAENKK